MTPIVAINEKRLQLLHPVNGKLDRRASLAVRRHQVVLLPLSTNGDAAARREIERQLPPEFSAAPWARTATSVVVWPAADRARSEAVFRENGLRLDGVLLSPEITPGRSFDDPFWLVPRRRPAQQIGLWLNARQRPLAATAAAFLALGLWSTRAAARVSEDIDRLQNERRKAGNGQVLEWRPRSPVRFLGTVLDSVPSGVQLLEVSLDSAARGVRIRGRSADYMGVSRMQAALSGSADVATVRPEKSGLVKVGATQVVEFMLNVGLK